MKYGRKLTSFTLAEMFAMMAMSAMLIALLVPFIAQARENARDNSCKDNLRQLGVAFFLHADRDPQSRLCTGAYDYRRDGCPDTWGWVADVMKIRAAVPGELLCPANQIHAMETLNDLLGVIASDDPQGGAPISRLDTGVCAAFVSGGVAPGTPQRRAIVQRLVNDGYNTNYSSSWLFARTLPKLDATAGTPVTRAELQGFAGTFGGLSLRYVEASSIVSSSIPLLGDAAPGNIPPGNVGASFLADDIPGFLSIGARLGKTVGDGPAYWNDQGQIVLMPAGTNVFDAEYGDVLPVPDDDPLGPPRNATHGGSDGILWLQDTRNWSAVHVSGRKLTANLLMADGSVRELLDLNSDGFLNPGFAIDPAMVTNPAEIGYADNQVEVPPLDVYSGAFIDKIRTRIFGCQFE